ncbi:MAG: hypothetical protein WDM87_06425 [Terracidiphilus sp.]
MEKEADLAIRRLKKVEFGSFLVVFSTRFLENSVDDKRGYGDLHQIQGSFFRFSGRSRVNEANIWEMTFAKMEGRRGWFRVEKFGCEDGLVNTHELSMRQMGLIIGNPGETWPGILEQGMSGLREPWGFILGAGG